ncbi:hypothetical protein [Legionella fairfieldensis]|uniref:hypothetical protein n=1 Tax=Legionella fairfieldensis TaxID=45064 RepID=UPI00049210FF|nr:hypothetical protein [Legionella fairfieldensis]
MNWIKLIKGILRFTFIVLGACFEIAGTESKKPARHSFDSQDPHKLFDQGKISYSEFRKATRSS